MLFLNNPQAPSVCMFMFDCNGHKRSQNLFLSKNNNMLLVLPFNIHYKNLHELLRNNIKLQCQILNKRQIPYVNKDRYIFHTLTALILLSSWFAEEYFFIFISMGTLSFIYFLP